MNAIEIIKDLFHQPFFVAFLAIVTCLCFHFLKAENKPALKPVWIVYFVLFGASFGIFVVSTIYRITHPQVWDFSCFYIWGKVAAGGHDFYQPANLQAVFNTANLPALDYASFIPEIVNVGFFYPPPTILYFAPLGFLSFKTALICWTLFNAIFVVGCIYLLYTMFFKSHKLNGFLLVSILFFIFLPSLETVSFSQTNFILLFYLLLMKKYEDKNVAGVLLALALFTKPYMFIFILFFMLRKKWGAILYFIISATALTGLTFAFFGKAPFYSYIFDSPVKRMPANIFSEDINQSLHAVLIRHGLITVDKPFLYLCITGIILLSTGIFLLFLLKRKLYDIILPTLLLVGLLVYAGTLSYYGVLLLFIVFRFFDEKSQLGFNLYWTIPVTGIVYYLTTFSVFSAICFLLFIVVFRSLWPGIASKNEFENNTNKLIKSNK